LFVKVASLAKEVGVKLGKIEELRMGAVAFDLLIGERAQALEVPSISLPQKFVPKHRPQRWSKRNRDLESDLLVCQSPQHPQQRKVGFGQCFKEPIFLEKIFVLRMPDEREVGVQDKREGGGHGSVVRALKVLKR
jgi:hypothetical protein